MKKNSINKLCSLGEVSGMIQNKRILLLAGDEANLKQLPAGNWIGGTIPYFINETGGTFSRDLIFVTDLTDVQQQFSIRSYDPGNIQGILKDRYGNGFTCLLIPGFSEMHQNYALDAESQPELFDTPVIGWITGIDLNDLGKATPKVINGLNKQVDENRALAIHVEIPESQTARLDIINIFQQGGGDELVFDQDGFSCKSCAVNGKQMNFAEYITKNKIDTKLPMVADYAGAKINISFQEVNETEKSVQFYAPVRKNVKYKIAAPVKDYVDDFLHAVPRGDTSDKMLISCNCILNYLYSGLENKKMAGITGPITFGEIAYVLVNQTMVYLNIE